MKILIADDCPVTRHLLASHLLEWGYEIISTENGAEAWAELQRPAAPRLVILDWRMPELSGLEVCRRLRAQAQPPYTYVILLTGNTTNEDIATGFAEGADDYVCKPFDSQVLQARLRAGERVLQLEQTLAQKIQELENARTQVKELRELLPICMFCKKIRDDNDYWHQIEAYFHQHTGTDFSHGICPDCYHNRHQLLSAETRL